MQFCHPIFPLQHYITELYKYSFPLLLNYTHIYTIYTACNSSPLIDKIFKKIDFQNISHQCFPETSNWIMSYHFFHKITQTTPCQLLQCQTVNIVIRFTVNKKVLHLVMIPNKRDCHRDHFANIDGEGDIY